MAFFDRSKISPSRFNGIKIQDFDDNGPGLKHGKGGTGDYSMNKNAILCFSSNYEWDSKISKRLVTFKGFVEGFKINYGLEREVQDGWWSAEVVDYLKTYTISYSLTFNVVAHSVNEARSNMARYSELLRILTFPFDTNSDGSATTNGYQNSYVLLSNLISNGRMWENYGSPNFKINGDTVLKYGLHVSVKAINMTVDTEMGYFEYAGQFAPKAFKISVELNVPNAFETQHPDFAPRKYALMKQMVARATAASDEPQAKYFLDFYNLNYEVDSRGFPFNVPLKYWNKEKDYPVVSALNVFHNQYSKNKKIFFALCPEFETIFNKSISAKQLDNSKVNHVVFDAFVNSFAINSEQASADFDATSGENATKLQTFTNKVVYTYDIELVMPAETITHAKYNCVKLGYLLRFVSIVTDKPKTRILMGNLIKDPKISGANMKYSASDVNQKGLQCQVHTCDLDVDLEAGFFEENGFFYPKVCTLKLNFKSTSNELGKMIYTTAGDEPKTKTLSNQDSIYWPFGIRYDGTEEE